MISIPSLSNSSWMRGAPHSGLACVICLIVALIWELADDPSTLSAKRLIRRFKRLYEQPIGLGGLNAGRRRARYAHIQVAIPPKVNVGAMFTLEPTPELFAQKAPQRFVQRVPRDLCSIAKL